MIFTLSFALYTLVIIAGCLAGMLVGFATALIWPQIYDSKWFVWLGDVVVYNLTLAFVLALVVNVAVSLIRPDGR